MKKSILFLFCALCCALAPSATRADDNANAPTDFGPWVTVKDFPGIDLRCKRGDYNSAMKNYTWYVEFRNHYQQRVYFSVHLDENGATKPSKPLADWTQRTKLDAGKSGNWKNFVDNVNGNPDGVIIGWVASSQHIEVFIGDVRLNDKDSGPYLPANAK